MELPPDQKAARLQQLNLQANLRPGATTSQYPGGREAALRTDKLQGAPQVVCS